MDKQNSKLTDPTFYKTGRSSLFIGGVVVLLIAITPFLFYSYDYFSKDSQVWETNLFGVSKFKGSPSSKHINVDANLGYYIEQNHFNRWLNLWFETVDELFNGELASRAKESARKMAIGQLLTILKNRPENKKSAVDNV